MPSRAPESTATPSRAPERARTAIAAVAVGALIVAVGLLGAPKALAATRPYAPLDQPGPPLSVPLDALRASLYCEPSVREAKVEPVLLNPATGVTPEENYSWNWELALNKLGIPWCAYTAPHATLGNIETSGEYLVYAIRAMYALAHRRIAVMGHSQGGMSLLARHAGHGQQGDRLLRLKPRHDGAGTERVRGLGLPARRLATAI
jgi:hypothetical protein